MHPRHRECSDRRRDTAGVQPPGGVADLKCRAGGLRSYATRIHAPRPHDSANDRIFTSFIEKYAFRHHVKSGVTGWAQVHGARGETDTLDKMQRRVELDIWYINNWSIWLDISVMIRTVLVVFTGDNAH